MSFILTHPSSYGTNFQRDLYSLPHKTFPTDDDDEKKVNKVLKTGRE